MSSSAKGHAPTVLGEVSGAFADLGTFLPLVIGMFALQQVDPGGVLIGFGVFALLTALAYRRPVPVQPMKAVAAVVIAGGLGAAGVAATSILLGLILIGLAAFGLVGRLGRLIPTTVMLGIQLGVGLYLAWAGIKLMLPQPWVGIAALALLLLTYPTRFKPLAALSIIVAAVAWGIWQAPTTLQQLEPGLYLPALALPDLPAFWQATANVLLPQLALTLTNATVITAAIAAEYYPRDRERITPDRLSLSTGVFNLALAPFGGFPMCHGAGGLVVQHRFGARSGWAPALFGVTCLALGLSLGPQAAALLTLLPLAAVGALLLMAGFDLAISKRLRQSSPDRLLVIVVTGIACVLVNVAFGLLVGLLAETLRARLRPGTDLD
ncbi:MAG: putative sulfate/molybdate transporter [Gammaproteobacteria bacterium]|nr:putative sulfate/molybdate transporter [Gammaproteobacteria bacterium]